ncbi:MAG: hypothetical protein HFG51_00440 [Lachnospiraceae bacterium]|nr:hypothetical protein [Lachnospiraceae bacterium]
MGRKDTVTKNYMKQNTIFADAFNYYIYGGQQRILPGQLQELDTTEIVVPYGADDAGEPEQVYRDVMKSVVAMKDEYAAYLLLGIENQGDVNYAMPVKNWLYDAINYAKQVQKSASSHREAKDSKGHSKGEFLSGFYKEDRLIPVITLVILFSPDKWDGPTSLHEMLSVRDEHILSLVPDYQIHLITPYRLSKDELKKFHSSLREVLTFIKYSKDREKMDEAVRDNFKKLRKEEIDVLNYCANVNLKLPPGEEEVDVCKAWEDMKQEVAKQTDEMRLLKDLKNIIKKFHVTVENAMDILEVPEAKQAELAAKLNSPR